MTELKSTMSERTLRVRREEHEARVRIYGRDLSMSIFVEGEALRDALLEAFPLPKDTTTDWRDLPTEKPKPGVVPGMVFEGPGGAHRVVLPNDSWYVVETGVTWSTRQLGEGAAPWSLSDDPVFDPRGAKALPSPLGIRVGDRVERTRNGVTLAFEVIHIDGATGHLQAKGEKPLGVTYNSDGFKVISREVPDRLPAGTIVRGKHFGTLFLRTEDGYIELEGNGHAYEGDDTTLDEDVRGGYGEVIYLP